MMRSWWLSLILLTIPVVLADSTDPRSNEVEALKSFININTSNSNVKQCVWFAVQEYNKRSEDKYIFLVAKILHAELQVKTFYLEVHLHTVAEMDTGLKE
ncbi:cystatin-8-like [Nannospalax galili]|uniref:cystatin-8-like n=1 Tax=Nannospalax galili TaxID=1026970 RepID=UPI0004ED468E|nr:cystatin-8-like [Nannospalax galili]